MERTEIIKLVKKNIDTENLEKAKKILEKEYEISYGKYSVAELKKAIEDEKPFFIKNECIIGFENNDFISSNENKINIERMVKAIIVEDTKDIPTEQEKTGDFFIIIGKNKWTEPISEFMTILGDLRVGEIFLPPHSAIFNFLIPTNKEQAENIVSYVEGVQVNIYSRENYVDNCIHEIGHLFWRGSLNYDEKQKFKHHFKYLKPAAIYEFIHERSDEEEMFATIYKWYVKSILLNPSFYNILEHEDAEGLNLLQDVFDRITKERMIKDIFEMNKEKLFDYLNPKYDITTGKKFIKKGLFDEIKDIELPGELLNDIDRFENGKTFINLNKAVVPVVDNRIDWEEMEKSKNTKYKSKKPDGKGGWIYDYGKGGEGTRKKPNNEEKIKLKMRFDAHGLIHKFNTIGYSERIGNEKTSEEALKKVQEIENSITYFDKEYTSIINKNGNIVLSKSGNYDEIEFDENEIEKIRKTEILTHTHPEDKSFSVEDVFLGLSLGIKEIRVKTPDNIYYFKISQKNKDRNDEFSTERKNRTFMNVIVNLNDQLVSHYRKIVPKGIMSQYEAEKQHRELLWEMITVSPLLQDDFNIEYGKVKK